MTISVTNIGTGTSNSGVCNVSVPAGGVPSGALIILGAADNLSGTFVEQSSSVTDTASNAYYTAGGGPIGTSTRGFTAVYYSNDVTALVSGNTISFHGAGSSSAKAVTAIYVTGCAANAPLDPGVTKTGLVTVATTTLTLTSGPAQVPGELFVGIVGWASTATFTNSSGWSTPPNSVANGTALSIGGGTQVNSGTGALTFGGTNDFSTSTDSAFAIVLGLLPAGAVAVGIQDLGAELDAINATATLIVPNGGIPAGSVILVETVEASGTAGGSFSDSRSNTYNSIYQTATGTTLLANFAYAKVTTALLAGDTIIYTKQTSGKQTEISAFYVVGLDPTTPLDTNVTASVTAQNSATPSVTSGTPQFFGEFFVAAWLVGLGSSSPTGVQDTVDGWNMPFSQASASAGGTVFGGCLLQGPTTKSAVTYNPNNGITAETDLVVVGFKRASQVMGFRRPLMVYLRR